MSTAQLQAPGEEAVTSEVATAGTVVPGAVGAAGVAGTAAVVTGAAGVVGAPARGSQIS